MKYGETLEGVITSMDEKGRGLIEHVLQDGGVRRVAIPFTFVGDTVQATFRKRDKGFWIAELSRVLAPASERVQAPCPHANLCGGCLWQSLAYPAQIALKQQALNTAYAALTPAPVEAVHPCPQTEGFRNRMDYAVSWKGDIGLKEYGSWNRYLDLSTCLLLDEATSAILEQARHIMKACAWEPWDARKHTGQFRYLIIRLGRNTGERLIHLLVHSLAAVSDEQKTLLREAFSPLCTSLILGENTRPTDVSYAETIEALIGTPYHHEQVGGIIYQIHPNAFFQTNTVMAEALQATVLDALGDVRDKHVLDLYGGIGFFGIACAKRGATVFGQELDPFAVSEARRNASLNAVAERCQFDSGPVERLPAEAWKADVGIIDPPRAGLHPKALQALVEHGPDRVVYVSCNYHSFLKELPALEQAYDLVRVQPLDLFPHTAHVEVVHTLVRRANTPRS